MYNALYDTHSHRKINPMKEAITIEIKIYQINMERDHNRVAFANLEHLERYQGTAEIDSAIYDEVFSGNVDCTDLEDVYRMFNLHHPEGYTGRSLSVSDVVQVAAGRNPTPEFYFCDSFGFEKVHFDPERVPKTADYGTRDADAPDEWHKSVPQDNTIRVVLLEPGKEARITNIGATLEDMQAAVGGYIEAVYPYAEEVAIVVNEEGKLEGLPLNRALRYEDTREIYDIIAGPCFICDCSGENFGSLTPEQARRYEKMFRSPEQFFKLNGKIIAVPYQPEPETRQQEDRSR